MKFKSIASRIIWSVVPVITLFTFLYIAVIYSVTYSQINNQINDKMNESLRAAQLSIQSELAKNANVASNMAAYAENRSGESMDPARLAHFVLRGVSSSKNTMGGGIWYEPYAAFPTQKYFSAYAYLDQGKPIVTWDYHKEVDYFSETWYLSGKQSARKVVWSDVYYDPVAQASMITATRPFFDERHVIQGVTTADMALTDVQKTARQIAVGESGKVFIVGKNGEYISFLDESRGIDQKIQDDRDPALAALGNKLLASESGVASCVYGGINESVYFLTLPEVGWKLVALVDTQEIQSSAMDLVLIMGIVPIIGLLLAVLMIILVAQSLRNIANKVNAFADRAASGDLSERIEIAEADEFGVMEDRLNRMISNMSEMQRHSDEMLLLAQEASKSKSEFLSRMSHEIRTPMNAIIGMTQIASNTNDMDKIRNCLQKTGTASRHLLSLINDILDMSKIEAGKLELYHTEFDLRKTLENLHGIMEVKAEEKKQSFTLHISHQVPRSVIGDEMRLSQVVNNLLSNAVKFTPEGGKIGLTVGVEQEAQAELTLLFQVSDTGIGLSEETQSRLFQSFEQADGGTSRRFGGTGLGLAIAKSIVEMMGGKIWIRSKIGEGSVFAFTARVLRGALFLDTDPAAPQDAVLPDWSHRHILLAEDVEINKEIVFSLLESTKVSIDHAENGKRAVALFCQHPARYDIILMDIQMPEWDGFEATRRIRALNKTIPIVAMTANAFQEDVDHCLAVGMNDHLSKPIDSALLLAKLKEYLS